jgi:hypothetical protein
MTERVIASLMAPTWRGNRVDTNSPAYSEWERINNPLSTVATCRSVFFHNILDAWASLNHGTTTPSVAKPQIIITDESTELRTHRVSWPFLRTGLISEYLGWANEIVGTYPEKFHPEIIVQSNRKGIGKTDLRGRKNRVYFIGSEEIPYIKIGITENITTRISTLQSSIPFDLVLLFTISGAHRAEEKAHECFAEYWKRGEWFNRTGRLSEYIDYMMNQNNPYLDPWEYGARENNE